VVWEKGLKNLRMQRGRNPTKKSSHARRERGASKFWDGATKRKVGRLFIRGQVPIARESHEVGGRGGVQKKRGRLLIRGTKENGLKTPENREQRGPSTRRRKKTEPMRAFAEVLPYRWGKERSTSRAGMVVKIIIVVVAWP